MYFSKNEENTEWCSVFTSNKNTLMSELVAGNLCNIEKVTCSICFYCYVLESPIGDP